MTDRSSIASRLAFRSTLLAVTMLLGILMMTTSHLQAHHANAVEGRQDLLQQTSTPPGPIPGESVTPTPTLTPTATPRSIPTECDPATFGGREMHLSVLPATARHHETIVIRFGFRNFGVDTASTYLRNTATGERQGNHWSGARGQLAELRVSAPGAGVWELTGDASGEGHACVDGRRLFGHTHVTTSQPFTITVAGAMVFVPVALGDG